MNDSPANPLDSPIAEDVAMPFPPRFRGTKRVVAAYLLLVVSLVGARAAWGVLAQRRFAEEVDNLRGAGFILLSEDYKLPTFDDQTNGGYWLGQALQMLPDERLSRQSYRRRRSSRLLQALWPSVDKTVDRFDDFAATLARVVDQPSGYWPDFGTQEKLAEVARSKYSQKIDDARRALGHLAMIAHLQGDDARSAEHIFQLNKVSQILTARGTEPTFCTRSIAYEDSAIAVVRDMLPYLEMESPFRRNQTIVNPARRDTIDELIADWLGSNHYDRFREQLAGYCRNHIAFVHRDESPKPRDYLFESEVPEPRWTLLKPWYIEHRLESIRWYHAVYRAASLSSYEKGVELLQEEADWFYQMHRWKRSGSPIWRTLGTRATDGFDLLRNYHQQLAWRRLAATALAIRMFEVDHGRKPRSIETLVRATPDPYLPQLPVDPFGDGAATFRYNPEGIQRKIRNRTYQAPPIIYSLDKDAQDSGGRERRWRQSTGDIVFTLGGRDIAIPHAMR